ncbi:MAG TPA: hypothetical protein PLM82_02090 [Candidatus Latescibacteria bacterium]|nr:hypothetical protein [Candidatus Latescibacterota bacterium]
MRVFRGAHPDHRSDGTGLSEGNTASARVFVSLRSVSAARGKADAEVGRGDADFRVIDRSSMVLTGNCNQEEPQ